MSILKQFLDSSVFNTERLMLARELYAPTDALPVEQAFARWTERAAQQNDIASARELAGLSDPELEALEAEFRRAQTRPPAAWRKQLIRTGLALLGVGALCLAARAQFAGTEGGAAQALLLLGLTTLLVGAGALATMLVTAFGALHLETSHGTVGLFVGKLDEQHPWLYSTVGMMRHDTAEQYRQAVLTARGPLRGIDHVMIRELVAAHEALSRIQPARAVAEALQRAPKPPEIAVSERRLVRVQPNAELRRAVE
jgi:hypothetical protein